jgi:hypothetical protein
MQASKSKVESPVSDEVVSESSLECCRVMPQLPGREEPDKRRWDSSYQSVWSDVVNDDGPGSNDCSSTDRDSRQDRYARANPCPVADFNRPGFLGTRSLIRTGHFMCSRYEGAFHTDPYARSYGDSVGAVEKAVIVYERPFAYRDSFSTEEASGGYMGLPNIRS